MIKYISDSSCDLLEYEGIDFTIVPITISTDERSFLDNKDLDVDEMMSYLASYKGRSYTACPSIDAWLSAFEGGDEIYVFSITSGLSGTYNSACMARDIYLEDHPDAKILVIDTLTTGPEMVLGIDKVVEWKKEGKSFEEISQLIGPYFDKAQLYFVLKSIHNLAENGRVNKMVAKAFGALNISLVGYASDQGTIEVSSKCRGDKKIISSLLKEMEKCNYNNGKIILTNANNDQLQKKIVDAIKEKYDPAEIKEGKSRGLCSFYAEEGCVFCAFEV